MMAECLLNTRGNARIISLIWVSKGFDRDLEGGEAIRSRPSNGKPKYKR